MRRMRFGILVALALAACAPAERGTALTPLEAEEVIRVTNHNTADVVVYLSVSGMRRRLGLVPTAQTAEFRISSTGLVSARDLRLVVDPIGTFGAAYTTEAILWSRGQRIELTVQRVLSTSHFVTRFP
ncbi:MAG TPA: hypothetical protein VFX98_00980 [Longimicrobiaceae bacterium]|nr:hypothetical protein [Longimicrobiaceae bacterium]